MKKECPACGGTGQTGFFQGVSRFLLTWEECPQCFGTGLLEPGPEDTGRKEEAGNTTRKRDGKAKK